MPSRNRFPRLLVWLAVLASFESLAESLRAAAPEARGQDRHWLPEQPLAVVEIHRPARLFESPLVQQVRDELQHSREVAIRLEAPEFDRVRQARRFLKAATGVEWAEAVDRLTAGGILLAVTAGEPAKFMAVVTAADADFLEQFVAGTREQVLARVPEAFRAAVFIADEHAGHTTWRVGRAWYAVVGRRLILANDGDLLNSTLDRVKAAGAEPGGERADAAEADASLARLPAEDVANDGSLLRISVDLDTLRKRSDLEKALRLPAEDAGAVAFFGGWLDLLRRSERVTADLSLTDRALDLAVSFAGGRERVTEGLAGFFATGDGERPLPLLELPGTLYSSTWFRDYASLWEHRAKLLTESAVQKMEEGDEAIRKQFSVFKIDYAPSEMFLQLGRQFRVVVARQEQSAYRVDVSDKLPASALAVTLRDEQKFAEQYVPLTRAIGLIATFEQGVTTRESEHRGAKLVGWWFRDDPEAVAAGNRARYNFAPTYSITRGHFIIGSTRRIVEQVIDALDQQAADGAEALAQYVTERQVLSLSEIAASLRGIRDSFTRSLAIDQGLTVEEAEQEFEVLAKVVAALGRVTAESKFTDDAFEYRLRIEPATNTD